MGTAIAVRMDYSSKELRRLASRVKNAGQARRLLAIAAVVDGALREEAAGIGGMDRQTLRDWVTPCPPTPRPLGQTSLSPPD